MTEKITVQLQQETVVNRRSGEVAAPSEYLANLREVEANIAHADEEILAAKAALKHAKDAREKLVAQLRAAVREGQVLPLLEAQDEDDVSAYMPDDPPEGYFEDDDHGDTGE